MDSRKNRGFSNGSGAAWDSAQLWNNIKNVKAPGCRHNKIVFMQDGKVCKECGEVL